MLRRMRALLALAIISVALPAVAGDLPTYSPERWCNKVAGSVRSEVIYGGCIEQEQEAYDKLKLSWSTLPPTRQAWCDKVASAGASGSYMILGGCVDQEREAAETNAKRTFRR